MDVTFEKQIVTCKNSKQIIYLSPKNRYDKISYFQPNELQGSNVDSNFSLKKLNLYHQYQLQDCCIQLSLVMVSLVPKLVIN